jgi:hypothetical protein
VPSLNYARFEQAMRARKQIVCMYGGYPRELCPVILGHSQGQEKALTYQFGGQSKSGLLPQGEWRCLWLSKVSDLQLREGPWFQSYEAAGLRRDRRPWCQPFEPVSPEALHRACEPPLSISFGASIPSGA